MASQAKSEDLLNYGCYAMNALLGYLFNDKQLSTEITTRRNQSIKKILQMLLHMKSFKVREVLTAGLCRTLKDQSILSNQTLGLIQDMNTVKRGLADMELDYDKTLSAIKTVGEMDI